MYNEYFFFSCKSKSFCLDMFWYLGFWRKTITIISNCDFWQTDRDTCRWTAIHHCYIYYDAFVYKNSVNITLNCCFILQYFEDIYMDVNKFCRLNILYIFKFSILQSFKKCRFSCTAASQNYASHMADGQLSFAEKIFKFLFIHLYLCFT